MMPRIFPRVIVLLPLLALAACQTTRQAGAPAGQIDIIAHRGASAHAPENTIAAFRLAHDMKAHWFELDCSLTSDDALAVMHDCDLERTTGLTQPLRETTLEEIRALDAGAWFDPKFAGEPVPTLGEALEFAKGRIGVYIEIKGCANDDLLHAQLMQAAAGKTNMDPALRSEMMTLITQSGTSNLTLTRAVIREVRARDMARQVVIQSFSPVVCLIALSEAPELRTEMLASDSEEHPERWPMLTAFAKLIRAHGFNAHHESLTPERIADFHENGMTVAAWTIDDPEIMRRLAEWGADAIITNKPDVARDVLAGRSAAESQADSSLVTSPASLR
jgi:glycerophosphoryl diester phosphodiesterase